MALAHLSPESYEELAIRDSEIGDKVREVRSRAEELAYESFTTLDDDGLQTSLYLLEFCSPSAIGRLSEAIETEIQLWTFSEFLLRRFPEISENPEYVFSDLIGRGPLQMIYDTVSALIGGGHTTVC